MDAFDASDFSGLNFESGFENILGLGQGTSSETRDSQSFDEPQSSVENNRQYLEPQCPRCVKYRADLERTDKEHRVNFQFLKKKIISTDMLIRRCKAKQEESETLGKTIDELNLKLEQANRDSTILSEQLTSSVEKMKPLKEENEQLEKRLQHKSSEINELHIKLAAEEAFKTQRMALDHESRNLENEVSVLKRKISALESKKQKLVLKTQQLDRDKTSLTSEKNIFSRRMEVFAKALQQAQEIVNAQWRKLQLSGLTDGERRPYIIPRKYKSFIAKIQAGDKVEGKEKQNENDEEQHYSDGVSGCGEMSSEEGSGMVGVDDLSEKSENKRQAEAKEGRKKATMKEGKDGVGDERERKKDEENDDNDDFSDVSVFSDLDGETEKEKKKKEEDGKRIKRKEEDSITVDRILNKYKKVKAGGSGVENNSKNKNKSFKTKLKDASSDVVCQNTNAGIESSHSVEGRNISSNKFETVTIGSSQKSAEEVKVDESRKVTEKKEEVDVMKKNECNDAEDVSSLSSLSDSDEDKDGVQEKNESQKTDTKKQKFSNLIDVPSSKKSRLKQSKDILGTISESSDSEAEGVKLFKDNTRLKSLSKKKSIGKKSESNQGKSARVKLKKGAGDADVNDLESLSSLSDTDVDGDDSIEKGNKNKNPGKVGVGNEGKIVADGALSSFSDSEEDEDDKPTSLPFTHISDSSNESRNASDLLSSSVTCAKTAVRDMGKEELKSILKLSSFFQVLSPLPPSPCPSLLKKSDNEDSDDNDFDNVVDVDLDKEDLKKGADIVDDVSADCDRDKRGDRPECSRQEVDKEMSSHLLESKAGDRNVSEDYCGLGDSVKEGSRLVIEKDEMAVNLQPNQVKLSISDENEPRGIKQTVCLEDVLLSDIPTDVCDLNESSRKSLDQASTEIVAKDSEVADALEQDLNMSRNEPFEEENATDMADTLDHWQYSDASNEACRKDDIFGDNNPPASEESMSEEKSSLSCHKSVENEGMSWEKSSSSHDKYEENESMSEEKSSSSGDKFVENESMSKEKSSSSGDKFVENESMSEEKSSSSRDKFVENESMSEEKSSSSGDKFVENESMSEEKSSSTKDKFVENESMSEEKSSSTKDKFVENESMSEEKSSSSNDKFVENESMIEEKSSSSNDKFVENESMSEEKSSSSNDKFVENESMNEEKSSSSLDKTLENESMSGEKTSSYDKSMENESAEKSGDDVNRLMVFTAINSDIVTIQENVKVQNENIESCDSRSSEVARYFKREEIERARKTNMGGIMSDLDMSSDESDSETNGTSEETPKMTSCQDSVKDVGRSHSVESKSSCVRIKKKSDVKPDTLADLTSLSDLSSSFEDEPGNDNGTEQKATEGNEEETNSDRRNETDYKKTSPISMEESSLASVEVTRDAGNEKKSSIGIDIEVENECVQRKTESSKSKMKGSRKKPTSKEFVELSSLSESSPSEEESSIKRLGTEGETCKVAKENSETTTNNVDTKGRNDELSSKQSLTPSINVSNKRRSRVTRRSAKFHSSSSHVDWSTDDDLSPLRTGKSDSRALLDDGNENKVMDSKTSENMESNKVSQETEVKRPDVTETKGELQRKDDVNVCRSDSKGDGVAVREADKDLPLSRKSQMECAAQQLARMIAKAKAGNALKNLRNVKGPVVKEVSGKSSQSERLKTFQRTRAAAAASKTKEETLSHCDTKATGEMKKAVSGCETQGKINETMDKNLESHNVAQQDLKSPGDRLMLKSPVRRLTRSQSSKSGNRKGTASISDFDIVQKNSRNENVKEHTISVDGETVVNTIGKSVDQDIPGRKDTTVVSSPTLKTKTAPEREDETTLNMSSLPSEKPLSDCSGSADRNIHSQRLFEQTDDLNESGGFAVLSPQDKESVPSKEGSGEPDLNYLSKESAVRKDNVDEVVKDTCADEGNSVQKCGEDVEKNTLSRMVSEPFEVVCPIEEETGITIEENVKSNTCDATSISGKLVKVTDDVSSRFGKKVKNVEDENKTCASDESKNLCDIPSDSDKDKNVSPNRSAEREKESVQISKKSFVPQRQHNLVASVNSAFSPVESTSSRGLCSFSSSTSVVLPSSSSSSSSFVSTKIEPNDVKNTGDANASNKDAQKSKREFSLLSSVRPQPINFIPSSDKPSVMDSSLDKVKMDGSKALNPTEPLEIIIPQSSGSRLSSASVPSSSSLLLSSSSPSSISTTAASHRQTSRSLKRPFSEVLMDMVNFFKMPRLLSPITTPPSSPVLTPAQDDDGNGASFSSALHQRKKFSDSQMMVEAKKLLAKRKASSIENTKTAGSTGVKRSKRVAQAGGHKQEAGEAGNGKAIKPQQKTISFSGFSSLQDAVDYSLRHFLSHDTDSKNVSDTVEDISGRARDGNLAHVWHCLADRIIMHVKKCCPMKDPWLERLCQQPPSVDQPLNTCLEPLEVSILELVMAFINRHEGVVERSVLMGSMWSVIFDQTLTSTGVRLSLCRLFCSMCKQQDDVEQARVLLYNIAWCGYLHFSSCLLSVLGVWPDIVPPIEVSSLPSPICQVFELVLSLERKEEPEMVKCVRAVIGKLCGWHIKEESPAPHNLVKLLLELMTNVVKNSQGDLFEYKKAMELLCVVMGPAWTQEHFVQKTLIALYQKWNKTSTLSTYADVLVALLKVTKAVLAVQSFSETTVNILSGQVFGKVVVTKLDSLPLTICFGEVLMELGPLHPERSLELLRMWEETNEGRLPSHIVSQLSQTRNFIMSAVKVKGGGGGSKTKKTKKRKWNRPQGKERQVK